MDYSGLIEGLLRADGATLPLFLVAAALALVGMALYAIILLVRKLVS